MGQVTFADQSSVPSMRQLDLFLVRAYSSPFEVPYLLARDRTHTSASASESHTTFGFAWLAGCATPSGICIQTTHHSTTTSACMYVHTYSMYTIPTICHRTVQQNVCEKFRMQALTEFATDTATDERIERHLMRQRGAGSRTVNIDFGFSFAGFSAPTSQEATPVVSSSEPPVKRRKTIAEEVGIGKDAEHENGSVVATDRRAGTKAARAKRRFVVNHDDELAACRNASRAGDEDSFVAGLGTKNRKEKRKEKTPDDPAPEVLESEASAPKRPAARLAKQATTKQKTQGKGRQAGGCEKKDGVAQAGGAEIASEVETTVKPGRRAHPKAVHAELGDLDLSSALQHIEVEALTRPKPKARPRRKAVKEAADEMLREDECPAALAEEPQPPKRKTRLARQKPVHQMVEQAPEQRDDGIVAEIGNQAPKKVKDGLMSKPQKRSGKPSAPDLELTESSYPACVVDEPPDEIAVSVNRNRREPKECQVRSTKKARTAAKSKIVKEVALERTAPKLERRPLQETDVNRSPSPRNSPEKPSQAASVDRVDKGKRKQGEDSGGAVVAQRPRKNRKLQLEVDERRPSGEVVEAPFSVVEKSIRAEAAATTSSKAPDTIKTARREGSKPLPALKQTNPTQAPLILSRQQDCGDEDVDWLFAPLRASTKPAPRAALKFSTARSKTKLADIDLDELISNVAAFAQSGGAVLNTSTHAVSCAETRKARKK